MLLAVDTSGRQGGIALANYDGEFAVIAADAEISGGAFSAQLIPEIERLLLSANATLQSVSAIAVITGPGSFTGLRIGLAAIKALCEIHPVPVVAVTMLELIAAAAQAEQVTALLDAGRGEAYVGRFQTRDGLCELLSEEILSLSQIHAHPLTLTPDATIAQATGAIQVLRPTPGDLALYAARKLARGLAINADALDAHYIRRPDAELHHLAKP